MSSLTTEIISKMDKNTYETYEFLPTSETEPDQFFVVQDDGTFLLNRQVQYVAEVQDVKQVLEDVQPCTVYGVSSQQFFVDVDNSAELISVSDQFMLPDGENGLYTNSYLLQPSASTANEQMEEDVVVEQYKPPNTQDIDIDVVTHNSKQGSHFTEITLSDEQYQTLEQKGWILLESNDKIFVLNTLGLHDITTNDKLIQKLKNEIQNNTNTEIDAGALKIGSAPCEFPNNDSKPLVNEQDTLEFVIGNDNEQNENIENKPFIVDNKENIICGVPTQFTTKENVEISIDDQEQPAESAVELNIIKQEGLQKETNSIKIKTKYNFKDIPKKIVLGKSINGKRLVAKQREPKIPEDKPVFAEIADDQHYNVTGLHEAEFVTLIQSTIRAGLQTKFNEEDVASADTVISQLLKVPNLKQSLIGYNLIVTKTANNKDAFGTIYNRSKLSLVTGRVIEQEANCRFEHLPNLLHSIKAKSENIELQNDQPLSSIEENDDKENFTIFHVHITETKCIDNIVRVSVTLNKRQLPINFAFDVKKRYPSMVFACSACAALFKSEDALKEHQQGQCMETDDSLTIDTDNLNTTEDDLIHVNTDKETAFSCAKCFIKYTKLSNLQRHIKTHHNLKQEIIQIKKETTNQEADTSTPTNKVYKCKMCPSTYFYAASLSKHIVTRHIKVKSN